MIVRRHFPVKATFLIPLVAYSRRDSIVGAGKKALNALLPCLMICRYTDSLGLGLFKRDETVFTIFYYDMRLLDRCAH